MKTSRLILAVLALLCAFIGASPSPVHATSCTAPCTKAQIDADTAANFGDNNVGAITPQVVRTWQNNLVNSIMPNAPVGNGNLACYNGTTGLLEDCGASPVGLVYGPNSSALGNIAWFNNTTGNLLGAAAVFQAGNPGNAALYSQIGSPPANVIETDNGLQISVGTPLGAGQQLGQGTIELQQAIVGTFQSDPADTIVNGFGLSGYAKSNGGSNVNVIGVGGFGYCAAANGNCWGTNSVAANALPIVTGGGVNVNFLAGAENDVNITKKSGSIEPTVTQLAGVYVTGGGDSAVNQGTGYVLDQLSVVTGAKWADGFKSRAGAAVNAFTAGPSAKTGNNVPSQNILIQETDSSGNIRQSSLSSNGGAGLNVEAPTGGTVVLGNTGANYLQIGGGSGSGVQLLQIAAAGMIVNDSSGNLSTTPTGTGVQTALGVAIGTGGSFVVNGGALGTPSSGIATSLTGTAAGLTAGHVTTNANLTGPITSSGNATSIAAQTGTGTTFAMSAAPTFTGTVTITSGLAAGTDGTHAVIGPGGTGALNGVLALNGSNATAQGSYLIFEKNTNSAANNWFFGHVSAIEGTGTSTDLEYFDQVSGARTMRLSQTDDSVAFASIIDATSTAGTVGAINTAGGISAAKQIQAGTNFKVGSSSGVTKTCGITIVATGGIITSC